MAVILSSHDVCLLDHKNSSNLTYLFTNNTRMTLIECLSHRNVVCSSESIKLKFSDQFFNINSPFMMDTEFIKKLQSNNNELLENNSKNSIKRRKRKLKRNISDNWSDSYHEMIKERLKCATDRILKLENGFFTPDTRIIMNNNKEARFAASSINGHSFRLSELNDWTTTSASNKLKVLSLQGSASFCSSLANTLVRYEGKAPGVLSFKESDEQSLSHYVIPSDCSFLMSEAKLLHDFAATVEQFDLIVLDPPWQNKSVKRKKGYFMLDKEGIVDIPVKKLARDGALIAIWTTNNRYWMDFVRNVLFPVWNVRFRAEWHWLKLTNSGKPVSDLESYHKKPYEHLILGQKLECDVSLLVNLPNHRVICSVPSSIHSHKPPLNELFKPYLREGSKCLELFARSLLSGWTSWGNEVILLQHLDFYELRP